MSAFDIVSSALSLVRHHPIQFVLALVIINLLRNKNRLGLVNVPGPSAAAYTGLWRVYNVWKGHTHLDAITLHKRHGNLVRIGPNHVSIADPKWIPVFYGMREEYLKVSNLGSQINVHLMLTERRQPFTQFSLSRGRGSKQ